MPIERYTPRDTSVRPSTDDIQTKAELLHVARGNKMWFEKTVLELRQMAEGGDPNGIRQDEDGFKGWADEDFQALLSALEVLEK